MRSVLLYFLVLTVALLASCKNEDSKLNGHWHFESDGINYVPFKTLDIVDTVGYKDKCYRGVNVPSLEVDRISKTFQYLDTHESNALYYYRIIDSKLEITDSRTRKIYFANKNPPCDIASDYVLNLPVKVDLPFSNVTDESLEQKKSLSFAL